MALPGANLIINNEGSTDSLNVTWTPPSGAESQNVSWYLADGDGNDIMYMYYAVFNGSESQYLIEDLTAGALYIVTVTAYNGTNSSSAEEEGRTLPNQVVLTPEMPTIDTVSASWDKPAGVVDQYIISCSNGTASPAIIDADNNHPVSASCTGLYQAGDEYNMTVISISGNETNEATIILRAFFISVPEAVTLREEASNTTAITAAWELPDGVLDTFNITCSNGSASPSEITISSDNRNGTFTASCIDLPTPGDEYTITVVSVSRGKESLPSSLGIIALPEAVTLEEESSNTTAITASWEVPDGVLDTFIITCSDGSASPSEISVTDESSPTVPNAVVLMEGISTTDSVSANWVNPAGLVSSYTIECSNGTANPSSINFTADAQYNATCEGLPVPGANYTMTVTSFSNMETNMADINLTALPLPPNLQPNVSTETSVSAVWRHPGGVIEFFEVKCSDGVPGDIAGGYLGDQDLYQASCENVSTPGDTYLMTVTSISGGQENPATVNLTALPEAVTLREESSNTTAITASWVVPDSVLDTFIITCSNGTASPSEISITSNQRGDTLTASCVDLPTPGEEYTITVVSLSNGKESAPSSLGIVALPEAVTLREEASNTTAITAAWELPDGVLDTFNITCSNGSASPSEISVTSDDRGDTLTASCIDLPTPGEEYTITVVSLSNGKESAPSSLGIIALPEAVTLREEASNTTAISAAWEVPDSVLDTFNISCSDGSASPSEISITSDQRGDTLTASCIDLPTPGEEYTITVVSISNDKESAPSSLGIIALPNGVELREGDSTTTSVSALWEKQNGTVDNYTISCSEGNASPPNIPVTDEDLGPFNASCVNLPRPGAVYTMIVYSLSGGTSNSSSTIHLRAVPESVENVTIRDYNTTAVSVEWTLKDCDCVYDEFSLTYEPDGTEPIIVEQMKYSAEVSGLTQGRQYNFTVVTISSAGASSPSIQTSEGKTVQQRTIPATATNLVITPDQRQLDLKWTRADGETSGYDIMVDPSEGQATFNENLTHPGGTVSGLTPGTNYTVTVVTVSQDERSEGRVESSRTLTDKPSQVQNPVAEAVDKNTIHVTWEEPAQPNGEITEYRIEYVGTKEPNDDHIGSDTTTYTTIDISDLNPGFSYTFTINATNDGGYTSDPASTDSVETPEEVPPPVDPDYDYGSITEPTGVSETSFTVTLPEDLFSHENGELTAFTVIISEIELDISSVSEVKYTYNEARANSSNGMYPPYITIENQTFPYLPNYGSRKRRATVQLDVGQVVVGEKSCPTSTTGYCNGPLRDNTEYYYAFRAYNGAGASNSATFGPVATAKDNSATVIGVSVSMSILVIMALVAAGFLLWKRRNAPQPERRLSGEDNDGFIQNQEETHFMAPRIARKPGSSMHKKSYSKPILLNNFESHYNRMKADSEYRFTEEYEELRNVGKDQSIVAATQVMNRPKNRFTNILPYEHSRVKLSAIDDEPSSDYINANYMPGYSSPREFIACQGPLPGTLDDMWRLVWEKKTTILVMLTQLVERGRVKCHQYWPEDYTSVMYGTIEVSLQSEQHYEHWIVREFTLLKDSTKRKVTQYHFMSWPDHGVPDQTWTMLDFVRVVREQIERQAFAEPIIVHCMLGVGRTGTYITLDRLMQHMQENDFIDIFGIICEMRMQRNYMVQTEKQYIFIHECVMDLMQDQPAMVANGDLNENLYDAVM
ncbi:receptor-type tyrosine-protein phosphatase eta-like [Diadema antillarum]|uniref:receptor-type tyrosine-protein phosphatase eta-like n=1 Tax=Diadema antillarum TaxID=105358 RepID=UPI003A835D65